MVVKSRERLVGGSVLTLSVGGLTLTCTKSDLLANELRNWPMTCFSRGL